MKKNGFWYRVFDLYYDGFSHMTLGKTLWLVIGIKLFIMFAILKVFFFPNFLKQQAGRGGEAQYVASQFEQRMTNQQAASAGGKAENDTLREGSRAAARQDNGE